MITSSPPQTVPSRRATPLGAGGWAMASYIISYAIGALIFIPLARLLDSTAFGIYTEATIYYGGLTVMVELPLIRALVRVESEPKESAQAVLGLAVVMGLAAAIVCAALGWPLSVLYNAPELVVIMPIMGLALIATALGTVPMALLWRELKFQRKVLPDTVSIAVAAGLAYLTGRMGWGVYCLIVYAAVRPVVSAIVAWLVVGWRPERRWPAWAEVRPFLPFVGPASGGELALHARFNMDYAIGGILLGSSGLGVYTLAWDSADKPAKIINSFFDQVGYSTFAQLQAEPDRTRRIFLSATSLLATITLPIFLGVLFVRQDIVTALLGAKWQDIVAPMLPLFILQALWIITHPAAGLVLALGHSRVYALVNAVSLVATAIAVVAGAAFGVNGLAWAMLITSGLTSLVWFGLAFYYLRPSRAELWQAARVPLALTVTVVAAIAIADFATNAAHLSALLRLMATVVVGAVVYLVVGWRYFPSLKGDLARLRERL